MTSEQMEIDDLRMDIDNLNKQLSRLHSKVSKLRCVAYLSIMLCDAIDMGADVRTMKDAIDFLRKNAKEATDETV